MEIETRKDLGKYFYKTLLTREELGDEERGGDIKPKSFIIESNIVPEKAFKKDVWKIFPTKDKNLFKLTHKEGIDFYLDFLDQRLWVIHSLSSSEKISKILYELVSKNNSNLDFIWLSSNFLEEIGELGKQRSFGLKFDNKFLKTEEDIEGLSMRFWGGPSKEIISDLKKNEKIKQAISLSSLGLVYSPNGEGFIKDSISSWGRFTVIKGNAIEPHFNLISRVKRLYSDLLKKIEVDYRISYSKEKERIFFKGDFLILKFSRPLDDLEKFIEILTSGFAPFRIWGVWKRINGNYIKSNCVDLHSGNKFYLELSPKLMRIGLDKDSCGNLITRIFTNLQKSFDSGIELYGVENERII